LSRPWHEGDPGDISQFPAIGRTQADFHIVWPAFTVHDGVNGYWDGHQFTSRGQAMPYDENEAHDIRTAILSEMFATRFAVDREMEDIITVVRVTW